MTIAYKMELCADCSCWIDEGGEIFWNDEDEIICESCNSNSRD